MKEETCALIEKAQKYDRNENLEKIDEDMPSAPSRSEKSDGFQQHLNFTDARNACDEKARQVDINSDCRPKGSLIPTALPMPDLQPQVVNEEYFFDADIANLSLDDSKPKKETAHQKLRMQPTSKMSYSKLRDPISTEE